MTPPPPSRPSAARCAFAVVVGADDDNDDRDGGGAEQDGAGDGCGGRVGHPGVHVRGAGGGPLRLGDGETWKREAWKASLAGGIGE